MIPLKNNPDCYIVNVPGDAVSPISIYYSWRLNETMIAVKGLKTEIVLQGQYEIIGEISADHIGFDTMQVLGLSEQETYSQLQASGVYFKNPYGESEPPQRTYDALGRDLNIEWHDAQSKLTQKSILIKKV